MAALRAGAAPPRGYAARPPSAPLPRGGLRPPCPAAPLRGAARSTPPGRGEPPPPAPAARAPPPRGPAGGRARERVKGAGGGLARPAARAQRARGHGPPPESAASLDARSAPHAPSRGAGRAAGVRLHPCHAASGSPSPPGRGGGGGVGSKLPPPPAWGGIAIAPAAPPCRGGLPVVGTLSAGRPCLERCHPLMAALTVPPAAPCRLPATASAWVPPQAQPHHRHLLARPSLSYPVSRIAL